MEKKLTYSENALTPLGEWCPFLRVEKRHLCCPSSQTIKVFQEKNYSRLHSIIASWQNKYQKENTSRSVASHHRPWNKCCKMSLNGCKGHTSFLVIAGNNTHTSWCKSHGDFFCHFGNKSNIQHIKSRDKASSAPGAWPLWLVSQKKKKKDS